jgi:hypothetical protein
MSTRSVHGPISTSTHTTILSSSESIKRQVSPMVVSAVGFNSPEDDDVARQLQRARAALEVSRAKMAAREQDVENEFTVTMKNEKSAAVLKNGTMGPEVPFFATLSSASNEKANCKRKKVIKSQNEEGLFTTDGDLMAKLSEEEEWESRSLLEVFESERNKPEKNHLAERDVAASIFYLRKQLQTQDFERIFDKRNRFIGEA